MVLGRRKAEACRIPALDWFLPFLVAADRDSALAARRGPSTSPITKKASYAKRVRFLSLPVEFGRHDSESIDESSESSSWSPPRRPVSRRWGQVMGTHGGTGLAQSPKTSPAGGGGNEQAGRHSSASQEPQAGSVKRAGGSSFAPWQVRVSHVFALLLGGGASCTTYSSPYRSPCKGFSFCSDSASSEKVHIPSSLVFLAAGSWGRSGLYSMLVLAPGCCFEYSIPRWNCWRCCSMSGLGPHQFQG